MIRDTLYLDLFTDKLGQSSSFEVVGGTLVSCGSVLWNTCNQRQMSEEAAVTSQVYIYLCLERGMFGQFHHWQDDSSTLHLTQRLAPTASA